MRKAAWAVVVLTAVAALQVGASMTGGAPAYAALQGPLEADFNGDGFADLAIGVPGKDAAGPETGAVIVMYGSGSGLTGNGSQLLTQGNPEIEDQFGEAVAAGDFNGDGFADLAVGVPREDVGTTVDAGAVELFYGSTAGLPLIGNQLLRQGASGLIGAAERGDVFGFALASGDFDSDGMADLAIGAPGENVGTIADAGAVNVVYGAPGGLLGSRNQLFLQNNPETGDVYGLSVATGDLAPGGVEARSDLAVGAPGETVNGRVDAGAVSIILTTASGLPTGATGQLHFQGTAQVGGAAEAGDLFGWALAAGAFDGGGIDLAVGAPGEDVGRIADPGAVNIVGGADKLLFQGGTTQTGRVPGASEAGDSFGSALATGHFSDGSDGLAIGTPFEDVGTTPDAGSVVSMCTLEGSFSGCSPGLLLQSRPELIDLAGGTLAAGDFNSDGFADLANGAVGETVGTADFAGAVDVRNGSPTGLPQAAPLFFEGLGGVPGPSNAFDFFGWSLSASVGAVAPAAAGASSTGSTGSTGGTAGGTATSGQSLSVQGALAGPTARQG